MLRANSFRHEDEVRKGLRLLTQTRLLVIAGPGGMGKTRLAISYARHFMTTGDEHALIAELAQFSDPTRLAEDIAAALSVSVSHSAEQSLINHLRSRHILLVLDNCEHLLMAGAHLAETLLRACSHLRILATSREIFGTLSALTWRIPALNETDSLQLL